MNKYIFCLLLFASCTASSTLDINKMKVIVWDLSTADALIKELHTKDSILYKKDSLVALYYNQIFQSHKISKEKFFTSLQYYQTHPAEYKALIDSATAYGALQRDKAIPTQKLKE